MRFFSKVTWQAGGKSHPNSTNSIAPEKKFCFHCLKVQDQILPCPILSRRQMAQEQGQVDIYLLTPFLSVLMEDIIPCLEKDYF